MHIGRLIVHVWCSLFLGKSPSHQGLIAVCTKISCWSNHFSDCSAFNCLWILVTPPTTDENYFRRKFDERDARLNGELYILGLCTEILLWLDLRGVLKSRLFFLMTLDFLRIFRSIPSPPYSPRIISENQFTRMDFRLIFEPYLRPPLSNNSAFNWPYFSAMIESSEKLRAGLKISR